MAMARPPRPKMNIDNFPEQPRVEKVARHIRIAFNGMEIAETKDAYWVLEAHRPPVYYLPASAIKVPLTPTGYTIPCKWKGTATYYAITGTDGIIMANRVWSFETPNPLYETIRGYVSFFARPWQVYVDGERVIPQRSDMRGGWVTSEIEGVISANDPRF
ncbi:Fc.00g035420.m01.CDS01 [Cosmosporella sp. VM-42]